MRKQEQQLEAFGEDYNGFDDEDFEDAEEEDDDDDDFDGGASADFGGQRRMFQKMSLHEDGAETGAQAGRSGGGRNSQQGSHSQNHQSTKRPGVRVLGRQFMPKTDYVNLEMARKPGVVPKMWDPAEDDLLRSAVQRYGEKDWRIIAQHVPGRNHLQCLQRWNKALRPGLAKGHWTPEEDQKLLELLKKTQNWQEISVQIPGRNAKQCRERWFLNLDPNLNRGPWTEEEDEQLIQLQKQHGGRWSLIAKFMKGRTENMVKSRYHTLQRQQVRERGWFRWEDRLIIEFCLTNGRQWTHLMKVLPGRPKGQIKKRYIHLMGEIPNLLELVERAEENINNGQINVGAKAKALELLPLGPPDQEKGFQEDDLALAKFDKSSAAIKEKAKSFRLMKPVVASAAEASQRRIKSQKSSEQLGNAFSSSQVVSTRQDGVLPPNMAQYQPEVFAAAFAAGSADQQQRKKLVHHKGSSWLEDFSLPNEEAPATKMKRTDSIDVLETLLDSSTDPHQQAGTMLAPPLPQMKPDPFLAQSSLRSLGSSFEAMSWTDNSAAAAAAVPPGAYSVSRDAPYIPTRAPSFPQRDPFQEVAEASANISWGDNQMGQEMKSLGLHGADMSSLLSMGSGMGLQLDTSSGFIPSPTNVLSTGAIGGGATLVSTGIPDIDPRKTLRSFGDSQFSTSGLLGGDDPFASIGNASNGMNSGNSNNSLRSHSSRSLDRAIV